MKLFWKLICKIVSRPAVVDWLIRRAMRTPYFHILCPDGSTYMERYWLFNPYPHSEPQNRKRNWFPISVRLHKIMRPDSDRHFHDHPWNARTIILRGNYSEVRPLNDPMLQVLLRDLCDGHHYTRKAGDTARLRFGEYHRIVSVSDGGVWTLFVTGKYRGTWGFLVDGTKVPYREYLGLDGQV